MSLEIRNIVVWNGGMPRITMGGQNGCAGVVAMYMRLGLRMRDGDTIGEELQDGDAQMRQLCSAVGDEMMPKSKLRYENAGRG